MDDRRQSIVNMQMVEYTGLFKILNPHSSKFYGINVLKVITKVDLFVLILSFLICTVSLHYSTGTNDLNIFMSSLMFFIASFGLGLNQFYLIKYSDAIWECMRVIYVGFLSFDTSMKDSSKLKKFKYKTSLNTIIFSCSF